MSDTDETEAIETEQEPDDSADKFPRAYVEKLRTEAKDNRHRAETAESRSDELTRQLFTLRVQATGKLADPTDLEFDADLLTDDYASVRSVTAFGCNRPTSNLATQRTPILSLFP